MLQPRSVKKMSLLDMLNFFLIVLLLSFPIAHYNDLFDISQYAFRPWSMPLLKILWAVVAMLLDSKKLFKIPVIQFFVHEMCITAHDTTLVH